MTFSSVVLPAPFGPMRPIRSPAPITSEIPWSARMVREDPRRGQNNSSRAAFSVRRTYASALSSTTTSWTARLATVYANSSQEIDDAVRVEHHHRAGDHAKTQRHPQRD